MLREVAAKLSASVDSSSVVGFMGVIDAAKGSIASLGGALALGAFGTFVKGALNAADAIDDASIRAGVTHDEIQRLGYMLKLNGSNAEQAEKAIFMFNRALSDSAKGSGNTANELKALGIEIKGSNGQVKSATQLLPEVADAIVNAGTEAEKTGIAIKFFGKQGLAMMPMLKNGSKGLKALSAEFDDLGLGISSEQIKASTDINDQIDRTGMVAKHAGMQLVGAFLPALTKIMGWVVKAASWFGKLNKQTNLLRHAAVLLAGVMVAKLGPSVLSAIRAFTALRTAVFGVSVPLWIVIAAIGSLYLIVEDLWVLMQGGDSLIGRVLDKFGGAGEKAKLITALKSAWEQVKTSMEPVKQILTDLWKKIAEGSGTWVPALASAFTGVVKGVVAGISAIAGLIDIVGKLAKGDTAGAMKSLNANMDSIFGKKQSIKEIDKYGNTREVSGNVGGLFGMSDKEYLQKAKEQGISEGQLKGLADSIAAKAAASVTIVVPPGTDTNAVKVTGDKNTAALAAVKAG